MPKGKSESYLVRYKIKGKEQFIYLTATKIEEAKEEIEKMYPEARNIEVKQQSPLQEQFSMLRNPVE